MRGIRWSVAGARLALALGTGAVALGCSTSEELAAASDEHRVAVEIDDPWGRPTPPSVDVGAFYLSIVNGGSSPDRLVAATSDRCGSIELHTTSLADGVMAMRPAGEDALVVEAGGRLLLEPAGLHAMCVDLVSPLVEGEEIDLELELEVAGPVPVTVPIEQR